jgi:lipid-A-disaccharide synthase
MAGQAFEIFLSAGEPSGDVHAANLVRELRRQCPAVEVVGYGGPEMAAAGGRLHADLTALAVMWLARAVANLPAFWALLTRADRYFRHHPPRAVVLVDYPGFNWWIARRAKAHGIPVFYYPPPQIWAWAQWRVRKMRRLVDHVLCTLPLEEAWFRAHGCRATYVGHPFFDEVRRVELDEAFLAHQRGRGGPLVTILPGSRTQEVAHNFPWFLKAARQVEQAVPQARFAVAAFKPEHAEMVRGMIAKEEGALGLGSWALGLSSKTQDLRPKTSFEVHVGKTPELMHLADCCMACSGSVSLELLYHAKPTVILYWISRAAYVVQGFLRKAKYITLVNLLADKPLFPEYLTCEDKSAEIAGHVIEWLREPAVRAERVEALGRLRDEVGQPGASRRAAEIILREIGSGVRS